jgi:hypothetical protein
LNAAGFNHSQLTEHWQLAKSLAAIELKSMRGRP